MKIRAIAHDLNAHTSRYAIGTLQEIRKRIKERDRLALDGGAIFHETTIDPRRDWTFHHGGRSELQFNIGKETFDVQECIRLGVAFSLEPSQTLPDVTILCPKTKRFNKFTSLYPGSSRKITRPT